MNCSKALRTALFALLLTLLTAFAVSALGDGEYRLLKPDCYGDDVVALKTRMHELGYFSSSTFNNRYSDDTAQRVRSFERACGLPETGIMTPALQTLLYSDDAVNASGQSVSGNPPALSEEELSIYRVIKAGVEGDDVLALKQKLKSLGYFSAKAETSVYNDTLAAAITAYQHDCGMAETGIADVLLQVTVYGEGSAAIIQGSAASVTPAPTVAPDGPEIQVNLPALNDQGFLADKNAAPFIHVDRDDGHWYYITQDTYIEIIRYFSAKQRVTWFETEIRCTPDSLPQAFLAPGSATRADGHSYITPTKMGKVYNMVFGITDDFYGYRWYNRSKGLKQGIIIRNGDVKAEETQAAANMKWPYLEILALFNDGTMRVFESDEYTAQQYLDMGVIDTFAFGPILVRGGQINQALYDKKVARYTDEDPRMAMGSSEPCHYYIITAKGRTTDSRGVTMSWMAERFKSLGCTDAMNLDGGGTAALYFMGDVVNKVENSQNLRDISSMFGYAAQE